MSTGSRGPVTSALRPRISARPVYEDFKPLMESKEDAEGHTVYIHVPGFVKDQLRIVADGSRGLLRVHGERLVAANTWSRFTEEVPVPANCNLAETRARFEEGVLRITMPKRISYAASQSPSPADTSDEPTTPERSPLAPPRPAPPPHPAPLRPVVPPPSEPAATPRPVPPPRTPAAATRPDYLPPQQTSAALPPPHTQAAAPRPEPLPPPPMPEPRLTPSIQPKPRDDAAKPKQSPPLAPRPTPLLPPPQPEAARFTPSIHPKPREDGIPKSEAHQQPPLPMPTPPAAKYTPPGLQQALPQPDAAPRKDPVVDERRRTESKIPPPPKAPVKSAAPAAAAEAPKSYESLTEDEKQAMKGMSFRRLEEDRKLLVNMGVAAMVIVALGAWISYSFTSSANPNN